MAAPNCETKNTPIIVNTGGIRCKMKNVHETLAQ